MLSDKEFEQFKSRQYCDNPDCPCYNQVGQDNIRVNSRPKGQLYCNKCKNLWVITKGTMFFGLRTPLDKVIKTLLLLVRGMGFNNTCRQSEVTADSVLSWIDKASKHVNEFSLYMQQEMHLEQVQIDEFWSFIREKKRILQQRRKTEQQ